MLKPLWLHPVLLEQKDEWSLVDFDIMTFRCLSETTSKSGEVSASIFLASASLYRHALIGFISAISSL